MILLAPAHIYCFPSTSCCHLSKTGIQSPKPDLETSQPSAHSALTPTLVWLQPPFNGFLGLHRCSLSLVSPGLPPCPALITPALYFPQNQFPLALLPEHTPLSTLFNVATTQQIFIKHPLEPGTILETLRGCPGFLDLVTQRVAMDQQHWHCQRSH